MPRTTFDATDYRGSGPENYEKFFVPAIGGPLAEHLVRAASLQPGERVLDVACGTGVVTRLAARHVGPQGTVAGLDVNSCMLAVARSATPKNMAIDWYETSAEATPLSDGSFDAVLCQMGLQFIPDKLAALQEVRRILQPGGRAVLNLPGPTPLLFAALAEALGQHIDPQCTGFVHIVFSLHDAEELRGLMQGAGFADVEVHQTHTVLRLPASRDFLWQYIHSTPLAALVAKASDEQRQDLEHEVSSRWQQFVIDGALNLELDVSTVHGRA